MFHLHFIPILLYQFVTLNAVLVHSFKYKGFNSVKYLPYTIKGTKNDTNSRCKTFSNEYPEWTYGTAYTDTFDYILSANEHLKPGEEASTEYACNGRITSVRFNGHFLHIVDNNGKKLQVMFRNPNVKRDVSDEEKALKGSLVNTESCENNSGTEEPIGLNFDEQRALDLWDIIAVKGTVKKTNTGEITLVAKQAILLAKCTLPPPDLWHGLKDVETRYRQRHLDILINKDTHKKLLIRSECIHLIRTYLHERGYIEVETPILQRFPSGATALPFSTKHNAMDMDMFLRIAPELYLKRLIASGFSDKVFEIGKCFRNEGISSHHSPEFTMIEIYEKLANMDDMIALVDNLVQYIVENMKIDIGDKNKIKWKEKPMRDLILEHADIDIYSSSIDDLKAFLISRNIELPKNVTWGTLVNELFKDRVEPHLMEPTHVSYLPLDMSPFVYSNENSGMHKTSRRFESYWMGMEIANGCTEECDPVKVLKNLREPIQDREFINSLEYGMPPTAGVGIGIDRLVMILANAQNIKDVQVFPLLR